MENNSVYQKEILEAIYPNVEVSLNDPLSNQSIVAEFIRYGLQKSIIENNDHIPIHILSLQNWVYKKLRCIYSSADSSDFSLFDSVLSEGPGPSLEFLGDVISLSNGYYLPSPTRAIKINETTWTLISGLPTTVFLNAGIQIRVKGIARWLININETELINHGIPIQTLESYIGLGESKDVTSLLDQIIENETKIKWSQEQGTEAYTGIPKSNGYGFDYWGSKPLEVNHSKGILSLWRMKKTWGGYDYTLTVKTPIKNPKPQLIYKNGRESWTILYFDNIAITLPISHYKKICLALDMLSNRKRIVFIKKENDDVNISIKFSPTVELMRYLHAIGYWLGYENQALNWKAPSGNLDQAIEIFNYVGVDVQWV